MAVRERAETVGSVRMLGMVGRTDAKYLETLNRGARFYRERRFEPTGRGLGRLPWNGRPASTPGQGIVTFSKLAARDPFALDASRMIGE